MIVGHSGAACVTIHDGQLTLTNNNISKGIFGVCIYRGIIVMESNQLQQRTLAGVFFRSLEPKEDWHFTQFTKNDIDTDKLPVITVDPDIGSDFYQNNNITNAKQLPSESWPALWLYAEIVDRLLPNQQGMLLSNL